MSQTSPARILYVVNIPRFFVTHRIPLARAARDAGYEVHVATSAADAENVRIIQEEGFPFHPLPLSQHGTRPIEEVKTFRTLLRLYRELQPDIVHHVTIKAVIYGGIAAQLTGVPVVVHSLTGLGTVFTEDDLKTRLLRAGAQVAYRLALRPTNARLIFQNPDDQRLFLQRGMIPPERTRVIKGSGVDINEFTPQLESDDTPLVVFVGRLLWTKGLGEYVQAAQQLHDAGVKARFAVVGYPEPSSPDAISPEQLTAWQAGNAVEWWGKRDDMPQVFAQSHIVCLPSAREGVPKVLIEAAACGRAAVTTDVPGCREVVRQGINGLLVPPGDAGALAAALRQLIENPAQRREMGARGRQIAVEEFALTRVLDETLAVYQELSAQYRRGMS
ncbi:MAG: glycosyltransferase family 4 protein [Anaerolineaceae bacterium]|nr:glycosyltransferase family 4 protein [Anaerolineaceae bacterium]